MFLNITSNHPGNSGLGAIVVACSWCNKIKTAENVWKEVEYAVPDLRLFEVDAVPRLSHGMCEDCRKAVIQKLEGSRLEDPSILFRSSGQHIQTMTLSTAADI